MHRMGFVFTFKPNTWVNIKDDVIDGNVDLGMMVFSPYRKNLVNYSRAVLRLYYQVVYRKGSSDHYDLRNLAGKEIAYMSSYPVTDTLTKVGAKLHVITDLHRAMRELNDGQYEAIICFRYQANYIIKHYQLKNLEAYDLTLQPREYCYVSKNKALIDAINPYLEQMEHDGTHQAIYGEISSQFQKFELPVWIWYVLALLILVTMVIVVIQQHFNNKKLRVEMKNAKRSERSKTVFLGNVSHSLRTPLNAIIGFSDVLKDDEVLHLSKEERQELYSQINQNGRSLLHFIDELLQLSDIESRLWSFKPAEYDIADFMADVEREARLLVKPGVSLEIEKTNTLMFFDEDLARLVVMQLLRNAAQHTTEGFIKVTYQRRDGGFYFQVADSGTGVPAHLKENIFHLLDDRKSFIQSEWPGLGLSICRAVVELCHGKIGCESEEGKGSTFWLWIPKYYWKKNNNITKK